LALESTSSDYQTDRLAEMEFATNYREWLRALTEPHLGKRVLEVGAGSGYMTECFARNGRELLIAMEPYPHYRPLLEQRFAGKRVEVLEADITDPAVVARLEPRRLDSAVSFNVFEHIADDDAAFAHVHAVLQPGGRFVCFVPAFPAIYGAMDAELGHQRRYSRKELAAKARGAGFEVVALRYLNLPGFFAWAVNARLLRRSEYPGGANAVGFWDRAVIPVARRLEARVKLPVGQSLLLVAQR
jgi:SAM-dependent methyltransferase